MTPEKIFILVFLVTVLAAGTAAVPGQSHNLSEIHPVDVDFDMAGKSIFNLSSVNLVDGLILDGSSIRDLSGSPDLFLGENSWSFRYWESGNPYGIMKLFEGGKVEIPNGNLDMGGNRVANVSAPQDPGDAVNKSYVDTSDDTVADDQNLEDVLSRGNSAGSYNLDMNSKNVTNMNCLGKYC